MSHQWCDKHWKPYQTELGGLVATARVMQDFIDHPDIIGTLGETAKDQNRVLKKHSPVCCFLGDTHMNVILIQIRVSTIQLMLGKEKGWAIDVARITEHGEDEAGIIWLDKPLSVYGPLLGPLLKAYEFVTQLATDGWRITV